MAIAILGTCDTKLHELLFLKQQLGESGAAEVLLIDFGRSKVNHAEIDIAQDEVADFHSSGDATTSSTSTHLTAQEPPDLSTLPRAEVLTHMTTSLTALITHLHTQQKITGLISAAGSSGTSVASAVMRDAVPIGFPKLLVSTVASGDTGPIVGETDIALVYSVVDIAGLNAVLRGVLANAAGAVVGMVDARARLLKSEKDQAQQSTSSDGKQPLRVAITMFGVTTPCATHCQHLLTSSTLLHSHHSEVEVYTFHATGHGGLAMERLIRAGKIDAVIDATTTEIPDYLFGGNMSAGPARLTAALEHGIPCVISVGACDMVNFGAVETVPEKYKGRKLLRHNENVTLMRTSVEENARIGGHIAGKIAAHAKDAKAVLVALPLKGVSMVSEAGGAFEDAEADGALFDVIERGVKVREVEIRKLDLAINDEDFAKALVEELENLVMGRRDT